MADYIYITVPKLKIGYSLRANHYDEVSDFIYNISDFNINREAIGTEAEYSIFGDDLFNIVKNRPLDSVLNSLEIFWRAYKFATNLTDWKMFIYLFQDYNIKILSEGDWFEKKYKEING